MVLLCGLSVLAALLGLTSVGLALETAVPIAGTALLAAPAFGAVSLVSALVAATLALRRGGS
jgi:hypothetical protein